MLFKFCGLSDLWHTDPQRSKFRNRLVNNNFHLGLLATLTHGKVNNRGGIVFTDLRSPRPNKFDLINFYEY